MIEPFPDADMRVRLAAFKFLEEQVRLLGEVLPLDVLRRGFTLDGHRVPLMNAVQQRPLIYFHGFVPGQYFPEWPVYVVGDSPDLLTFTINIDDHQLAGIQPRDEDEEEVAGRRRYVTRVVQQRAHQAAFRLRVIEAYRRHCAICRLRHQELLEAAHILPDGHPRGEPIVPNGLSLCALHHGAFDANILGVTPDYKIEIRDDVLREKDGPMLIHGLQTFHGAPEAKRDWHRLLEHNRHDCSGCVTVP